MTPLRPDLEGENFRWEQAIRRAAQQLETFRRMNAFSQQLNEISAMVKGEVDLPDLIYAEATRVIDPASFYRIFSNESSLFSPLPDAYDSIAMSFIVGFRGRDERRRGRIEAVRSILAKSQNTTWILDVLREVFDVSISRDNYGHDDVKDLPEPTRQDKLSGRLKHPDIVRAYRAQMALANQPLREFMARFESEGIKESAEMFWSHLLGLFDKQRRYGSEAASNFLSDLVLGYSSLFKRQAEKSVALLKYLASISIELKFPSDSLFNQVRRLSQFMWALCYWSSAESRKKVFFEMIALCSNPMLVPEFCFPLSNPNEFKELLDIYTGEQVDKNVAVDITSWAPEVRQACTVRFAQILADQNAFNGIEVDRNNFAIFNWYASSASDKNKAQNSLLAFFQKASLVNPVYLEGLNQYLALYARSGHNVDDWLKSTFGEPGTSQVKQLLGR
jgi:hypothetical protein